MARIRSIHPDSCVSATLAQLTGSEERTFWRLLTHCDDEGRARADWRLVKASIYPLHDDMTPEMVGYEISRMAELGLLVLYACGGKDYLQVTSWHEYQHPKKAAPSKLPPPPPTSSPLVPHQFPTSSPPGGKASPTLTPQEKERERGEGEGEGEGGGREMGEPVGNHVPHPSPATRTLAPWLQEELQSLGVTDAQARVLEKSLGHRLPAALFKLRSKAASNPAGLLVRKGPELAQEGEAMLSGLVARARTLAPKDALLGAQWGALPECLRCDLEVEACWLAWRAAEAKVAQASEEGRFEAMGERATAQRMTLELLEHRHPERERIRVAVSKFLGSTRSDTARRGALMQALGLVPGVPTDLQVMPLAVGMTK